MQLQDHGRRYGLFTSSAMVPKLTSRADADELEWYIPSTILPKDLQRCLNTINQYLETPIDLEGRKPAELLQKKRRRRTRRKQPESDAESDADENAEEVSASSLSPREHLIWPRQAEREGESRESR